MEQQLEEKPSCTTNKETRNAVKKMPQRKLPAVKQTLTSLYRLAKANPLLISKNEINEDEIDGLGLNNIKLPKSILQPTIRCVSDNVNLTANANQSTSYISTKPSSVINNNSEKQKQKSRTLCRSVSLKVKNVQPTNSKMEQWNRNNTIKRPLAISKYVPKCETQSSFNNTSKTCTVRKQLDTDSKNKEKGKRRSRSAEFNARKKLVHTGKSAPLVNITQSNSNNISKNSVIKKQSGSEPVRKGERRSLSAEFHERKKWILPPTVSPIRDVVHTVTFKTPNAHQRRSVTLASITPTPFRKHFVSTQSPIGFDLQQNLEKWLQSNRKSVNAYRHLKCFGLHPSNHGNYTKVNEENKENIEDKQNTHLRRSASYEDLKIIPEISVTISTDPTTVHQNKTHFVGDRSLVQDALTDLHKLILAGYPHHQCEAWLKVIAQKYQDLDDEPQYWECRAAIEQTRGNITSAVECLRTAIIQGAEVKSVDYSLEQLLQKFSLLNISTPNQDEDDMTRKDRERIILDARNVFKSSIIQFAVQERKLKKKNGQTVISSEKKFIATPVRRSTRQNRSRYTSTPDVKLYASLHELNDSISNSLDFHGNNALVDKLC